MKTPKITPFNGDHFIQAEIKQLVERWRVRTIVETGSWACHTTRAFREMLPPEQEVLTIDRTAEHLFEELGDHALDVIAKLGITFVLGDSGTKLPAILQRIQHPALFYLDAHGGGSNPLKEEIMALAACKESRNNCVVAIHDVITPETGDPPRLGYNMVDYGRGAEPLGMAVFQKWIEKVYPRGFKFHHNSPDRAAGSFRGIVYIYPGR